MNVRVATAFLGPMAALCFTAVPVKAETVSQHLCADGDLMNGTWRLVQLQETPANREALTFRRYPNQYLAFHRDYSFSHVRSDVEATTPDEIKNWLAWPERQHVPMRYTIEKGGILSLYTDNNIVWRYSCVVIEKDTPNFKAGDLILNGYARVTKARLYKVYRRWF